MCSPTAGTPESEFEAALEALLGDRVRQDEAFACRLWSSLTNTSWRHSSAGTIGYSFRSAGGLVAQLRREGCYLDWYMCGEIGSVDQDIAAILAGVGWRHSSYAQE